MVRVVGSIVAEYLRQIRDSGSNPRLYLTGVFLIGLGQSIFTLLFNLYLRELGASDSTIGQVLSKMSLGAAVAAIPVALVLRQVAARSVLIASGGLTAIAFLLQSSLTAPDLLLTVAFLAGTVMTVFRLSIAPVIMREAAPGSRPFLFSAAYTVLVLSAIIGSTLGGFLPRLFGWLTDSHQIALRLSLFAACGLFLLSTVPFSRMTPRPPAPGEGGVASGRRARDRAATAIRELAAVDWGLHLKLVIPSLLIGLGAGVIIPFLNLYFRDRFGLDEAALGLLFAATQAFMVVGNIFGPAITRRVGLVRGVVLTQLASVPFMVVLAMSHWFPAVAGALFLRSALMNMNQPLASHFAMEVVTERDHAITNSLLALSWFLAWSVSADIGGAMIERVGYAPPLFLAAVLYVAASILYWLFFRKVEEARLPRSEVEIPEA